MPGSLVVFEGAEGVGKTTQAVRLVRTLEGAGIKCVHLREPGGTSLGESIRNVLLEPSRSVALSAEALLFMASRAQLVTEKIRPALECGSVVVLDRFFLSTYAYQVTGRGLPEAGIRAANQLAVGDLTPTVTLVLSLPANEGLERAARRSGHDYMEQLGDEFHQRVGEAFDKFVMPQWQATHEEAGPIVAIDASGSADDVFVRVVRALGQHAPDIVRALEEEALK